jgi:hypothetical protein
MTNRVGQIETACCCYLIIYVLRNSTLEAFQPECVLTDYRCDISFMLVINSVNMLFSRDLFSSCSSGSMMIATISRHILNLRECRERVTITILPLLVLDNNTPKCTVCCATRLRILPIAPILIGFE